MKSKILTTYHIGLSLFLLSYTVLILSCSGCKNSNIANTTATMTETIPVVKQDHGLPDSIDKIIYVNDSTRTYKDITILKNRNTGNYTVKFPNGKTLSDTIDIPLIKEIPVKYVVDRDFIISSPTYGVIDIRAMDMKTKNRWFSKMDGVRDINKLIQGIYRGGIDTKFMDKGIILKYTFVEVEEKIVLNEEEWKQAYVGSVAVIEAYDLKGNKLYEINSDKYGGYPICVTENNKYLITYSQGKDEGEDRSIFKNASLSIYNLSDGKLLKAFLMPDYTSEPGCGENYLSLTRSHTDLDTIIKINIVIEKNKISTLQFQKENLNNYLGAIEDGSFKLKNGTIISYGFTGFNQYTFDEWNQQMSKKENLND